MWRARLDCEVCWDAWWTINFWRASAGDVALASLENSEMDWIHWTYLERVPGATDWAARELGLSDDVENPRSVSAAVWIDRLGEAPGTGCRQNDGWAGVKGAGED